MAKIDNIILKKLNIKKDITEKYLKWMNDKIVHKYTEQKYSKHTLSSIRNFVKKK